MSVNKIFLVGRLGKDPELRTTTSGEQVANFPLATSEKWTDKNGKAQEKTEWHRIVAWRGLGALCGEYLSKGSQVFVEGTIQTQKYEDKNGDAKYATSILAKNIQFLDSKPKQEKQKKQEDKGEIFDDIPF